MSRIRWADVVEQARAIVLEYDGGVTLRQVHYRAVPAGLIPNTPCAYRHLSSHLARARREDDFPDLIDTLRYVHVPQSWPDAGALGAQVPDLFQLDRTHALYVAAEKDSLRVMFTATADPPNGSHRFSCLVAADLRRPPSRPRATPWTRTPRDGSPRLIYETQKDSAGDVEKPWLAPSPQ
jgi:hypothetical protein